MQLWIQVKGIVVVYAVVIVGTLITLLIVRAIMKLRVEPQEEIYGLDLTPSRREQQSSLIYGL